MKHDISRRGFLRGTLLGSLGAVVTARIGWLFPESQRKFIRPSSTNPSDVALQASTEGELYAGFLLLPDGAPLPAFVRPPQIGIPIFCGVGVGKGGPRPTAVTSSLKTVTDLQSETDFPIYTFGKLSQEFQPGAVNLIKHTTGEIYAASVIFESIHQDRQSQGIVSITTQPDFPRPFPLWSCSPVEPDGPAVILEKVDFLPSPGIVVATLLGFVFHWIEKDVLYTLLAEYNPSREEATLLASSLEAI